MLTKQNPDSTAPKLTEVEAVSIFNVLLERGLIFRAAPEHGQNVFHLHEAKEREWNAFISELKCENIKSPNNLIPPPTSEKSGDKKPGNGSATNKQESHPETKLKATQFYTRMTQLEWGGFLVDFYVILWIWSDFIECHDFSRIIFLFAALLVAHGVLCYFLFKLIDVWKLSVFIWILLCFFAALTGYKNSRPLPTNNAESKSVEPEPDVTLQSLGIMPKWQPPELPTNCSNVFVEFGEGVTVGCPITSLTNYPIITTNLMPGFGLLNGKSPIAPYIKDNRFYVGVENLFRTNLDTVFMNEDLDYALPKNWDRNYDSNAFEIIAEDGLPVLQIKYVQPNAIQVNGIFFISTNHVLVAFGHGIANRAIPITDQNSSFFRRTNWFKYPSKEHLGQLADQ